MPTYQYACTECGDRSEVVQRFSDDPLTVHDDCGGKLRKVFSPVGIVFKGSGFYRTDSRSGGSSASATTAPSKDSADSNGAKESKESKDSGSSTSSSSSSSSGSETSSSSGSTVKGSGTKSSEKVA